MQWLRSKLCDGSNLLPLYLILLMTSSPSPPLFLGLTALKFVLLSGGVSISIVEFRSFGRCIAIKIFKNADSVHPHTALTKLKYVVTLGSYSIDNTPGGWSLHEASLSTAPSAYSRGAHSSSSIAEPDNLFVTPDDFRSSGFLTFLILILGFCPQ